MTAHVIKASRKFARNESPNSNYGAMTNGNLARVAESVLDNSTSRHARDVINDVTHGGDCTGAVAALSVRDYAA